MDTSLERVEVSIHGSSCVASHPPADCHRFSVTIGCRKVVQIVGTNQGTKTESIAVCVCFCVLDRSLAYLLTL